MKPKAVFLDRDDTIIKDVPYCSRPEDVCLLPLALEGIKLLNKNGFKTIIITNQSGIARGYFDETTLGQIHEKMKLELHKGGAFIDAIYYCPHHPNDSCDCRKPKTKMIIQAKEDFGIDLDRSYFIGDDIKDMELGRAVGCKTVKIVNDNGKANIITKESDHSAYNLLEASKWILKHDSNLDKTTTH